MVGNTEVLIVSFQGFQILYYPKYYPNYYPKILSHIRYGTIKNIISNIIPTPIFIYLCFKFNALLPTRCMWVQPLINHLYHIISGTDGHQDSSCTPHIRTCLCSPYSALPRVSGANLFYFRGS